MPSLPEARAFRGPGAFRAWLERHHDRESDLLVCCFKSHAADKGLTYLQALDEALCFGWIDGVRRSLDADSFSVRFSPRRTPSKWSAVNTRRALALEALGRMQPRPASRRFASGERATAIRRTRTSRAPRSSPKPCFGPCAPMPAPRGSSTSSLPGTGARSVFWIMSAKQESTQLRRLDVAIGCWEKGQLIPGLRSARKPVGSSPDRVPRPRGGKP